MPADAAQDGELHELDEFISLLAHDLRTPLTSIRGYAQLLLRQRRDAPADDSIASGLRTIMDQADRLAGMTDILLDVSRVRLKRIALRRTDVNLASAVRLAIANVHVDAAFDALDDGPMIDADAQRVQQVVVTLLRYLRDRAARIQLKLVDRVNAVVLSVEGEGLRANGTGGEGAAALFQHLVRRADTAAGWQLAHPDLYVAHGVAEAHGGSLSVQATKKKGGLRFTLTLPK